MNRTAELLVKMKQSVLWQQMHSVTRRLAESGIAPPLALSSRSPLALRFEPAKALAAYLRPLRVLVRD